jgi:hypothetical protein
MLNRKFVLLIIIQNFTLIYAGAVLFLLAEHQGAQLTLLTVAAIAYAITTADLYAALTGRTGS